jgi:hypothetical protein
MRPDAMPADSSRFALDKERGVTPREVRMSDWQSLGGVFTTPPHIVSFGPANKQAFVFAVGTDQALWYRQFDGSVTWSPWQSLGGVVMSPPFAIQSGASSVDVFAVGASSELLHWHFQGKKWTEWPFAITTKGAIELEAQRAGPGLGFFHNWESLGGILMSPPHAVMFGESNDLLVVFALGTDHAVWFRQFQHGSWSDWDTIGHTLISKPHAVTWQRETLVVFALGTDSAIWWWNNIAWASLGGTFTSQPFAISTPEHVHVFAVGTHSDLQHRRWNGNDWDNWESLGGILESPPTAVDMRPVAGPVEQVIVYTVGTDSAAWKISVINDGVSIWESLGGVLTSSPHAAFTENILSFVVGLLADHTVGLLVDR